MVPGQPRPLALGRLAAGMAGRRVGGRAARLRRRHAVLERRLVLGL